jgi:hypothetical protein
MPEFISATADIRDEYRYTLTRVWDPALPMVTFVLLNQSGCDCPQGDDQRAPFERFLPSDSRSRLAGL